MSMKRKVILALAMLFVVSLLAGCQFVLPQTPEPDNGENNAPFDAEAARGAWQVEVMLEESEGITVTGQNPVTVGAGEEASFTVELAPGYKIDGLSSGAVYEDGVITISDVWYPTTVEVSARHLNTYVMYVENDPSKGKVNSSVPGGKITEDTEVTLKVTPAVGCVFTGYSLGKSQAKGGEIVCSQTEYTFRISDNIEIYTNYYYVGDGRLVIYESNGGEQGTQYDVFSNSSVYICPHSLANQDYFTRPGYVLYGYNTQPDGSGTYYGTGWNVPMPDSGQITLYAQWMPESPVSDFSYTKSKTSVTIEKYNGNDDVVVIPETIDGLPVTLVRANAFENKSFHTLYINKNILNVAKEAIKNCANFTTLYLCDNVRVILDASFANCPNFSKLYMLACMAPRYTSSRNGTYQMKYQRLITAQEPKLVITSGSNSAYGIDSALLEKLIGKKYNVVNYGCNQDTPASFYIEVAANFIQPGDILLHEPESRNYQWGYNEMNTTTWQIFEGAFDAFSLVDIRHFFNIFNSFSSFNDSRVAMTPRTYENYTGETVNQYGDYIKLKTGTTIQTTINGYLAKGGAGSSILDESLLTKPDLKNLNNALDMITAKGGKVYISFGCFMKIALTKAEQTTAEQQKYKQAVIDHVHGTVISDPSTYMMDYKYFYNSTHHLNTEGSQIRTTNLAKDLMAQFAKEK